MMPRLESDIVPLLAGAARGELAGAQPAWRAESSVCVVLASGGYPGAYPTGRVIEGLDQASSIEGVHIFHAGTRVDPDGRVLTAGGRVLAVVALGTGIEAARRRAYEAAAHVSFEGRHCRSDIAKDVPS
jgi:phosphoribosylamine--glycine ligase